MATDRVIQFRIPNSTLSYSIKLTYDKFGVLSNMERQEVRKSDRSVNLDMLSSAEQDLFIEHFASKVQSLPVIPK